MVGILVGETMEFATDCGEHQKRDEDVPESVHGGKFKARPLDGKREVLELVGANCSRDLRGRSRD